MRGMWWAVARGHACGVGRAVGRTLGVGVPEGLFGDWGRATLILLRGPQRADEVLWFWVGRHDEYDRLVDAAIRRTK